MHPSVEAILVFFDYSHLPDERLQNVSRSFEILAFDLINEYDLEGPELTVALRKLLEAKDCAVRAALTTPVPG